VDGVQGDRDQALALGGLQAVFDANIIGIAFSAADGTVIAANDSYLSTLGFTRDELAQGRVDWRVVTPPEHAEADAAALAEFAERGAS
jgi:PAS domain-containing protein